MCGVIGIYGEGDVVGDIYEGLISLQHRGQDAAGICTFNGMFHLKKGLGFVRDVFDENNIRRLKGDCGIGHIRYTTVGGAGVDNAQPFMVTHPYGIAMCHNGNLTNFFDLKKTLAKNVQRHVNSGCDVEALLNVFAAGIAKNAGDNLTFDVICNAMKDVFGDTRGSYSTVAVIGHEGFVAFRDPHGIRPLIMGKKQGKEKMCYAVASESIALDLLGFTDQEDILPGEVVFVDKERNLHRKVVLPKEHNPCIFEYIYIARPDSFIDKVSVYKTRMRMGGALADKIKSLDLDIDVVVPVPDSSRPAATEISRVLGIPYREALVKSRYVARTFIMPEQSERTRSVKRKLNAITIELKDKRVLLVDDSVVRGTTSKKIIEMVRDCGAKAVYFASYASALRHPCVYGVDMSRRDEFVAKDLTDEGVGEKIGADKMIYQEIGAMIDCAKEGNSEIDTFCTACFDGKYPTDDVTEEMFAKIAADRDEHHE